MRLLQAELTILRRPLAWAVMAAAVIFCVLLAMGGAHNAAAEGQVTRTLPTCAAQGIPPGP